jgi:hypothetical protein
MTQPLIRDRQYGLPQAQKRLQEAYEGRTADLVKDIFSHATFELPTGYKYHFFRNRDWAAVIGTSFEEPKVQRVALWSLLKRCEVWNIAQLPHAINPKKCKLSSSGLVLLPPLPKRRDPYLLASQGCVTSVPRPNREKLHLIGNKVFLSWSTFPSTEERPTDLRHEECSTCFGELDYFNGEFNWTTSVSHASRMFKIYTTSNDYWVSLSTALEWDVSPLIEVVDITQRSIRAIELPFKDVSIGFHSACIVQQLLFYGIERKTSPRESSIGIFDLDKGVVIAEYSTEGKGATPGNIVANEHFVAWSEDIKKDQKEVKYLNLTTKKITSLQMLKHLPSYDHTIQLHLSGSLITINYPQSFPGNSSWHSFERPARWRRKVIDLNTGKKLHDVMYPGFDGIASFNDGIFFRGDPFPVGSKMYIESFIQDDNIQEKSEFRA